MKRRRILTAICIIMMTLPVGLAYSDVTWIHATEESPSYNFSAEQTKCAFFYPPENYGMTRDDTDQKGYNPIQGEFDPFNSVATSEVIEFGGDIRMFAMAMGPDQDGDGNPVNPSDGLKVQACAQIIPDSLNENHGISAHQEVTSWSTRWFKVDQDGYYEISAQLDGVIKFDTFFNSDLHRATEAISALVTLEEMVLGGDGEILSAAQVDEIQIESVTETPASATLILSPTNSDGEQITYRLKGRVNLTSDVANYDWPTASALETIDGTFNLGTPDDPIALTATVTKSATDSSTTGNQGVTSGTSSSSGDSGGGGGGGCFIDAASFHEK